MSCATSESGFLQRRGIEQLWTGEENKFNWGLRPGICRIDFWSVHPARTKIAKSFGQPRQVSFWVADDEEMDGSVLEAFSLFRLFQCLWWGVDVVGHWSFFIHDLWVISFHFMLPYATSQVSKGIGAIQCDHPEGLDDMADWGGGNLSRRRWWDGRLMRRQLESLDFDL